MHGKLRIYEQNLDDGVVKSHSFMSLARTSKPWVEKFFFFFSLVKAEDRVRCGTWSLSEGKVVFFFFFFPDWALKSLYMRESGCSAAS